MILLQIQILKFPTDRPYFSTFLTPLSHRPTPGQNFAWGRVPNIALCVGMLCGAFFVWGAQFSNVNCAWTNNFRVNNYKNCVGMGVLMNSQQESFCGDEKKSTFCVGNSWGRPHASPHNIFLRGDAWGDVWGGYAWVSETGV